MYRFVILYLKLQYSNYGERERDGDGDGGGASGGGAMIIPHIPLFLQSMSHLSC